MSLTPRLDRIEKNYWLNSNLDFWQRGTSFSATNVYTTDRIALSSGNITTLTRTVSRSTDVPTGTYATYSLQYQVGTAEASAGTNKWEEFTYKLEGYDFAPLYGKSFTLGFWVKSSIAGVYSCFFRNGANNRSYVAAYTVIAANTWEYKTISVTHDTTGTWTLDNTTGMFIGFPMLEGTQYQTATPGQWVNNNFGTVTGQVQLAQTAGAVMKFAQFMLVAGTFDATTMPNYARAGRTIAEELIYCQRYFNITLAGITTTTNSVGAVYGTSVTFPATMRAVPTVGVFNTLENTGFTGANQINPTVNGYHMRASAAGAQNNAQFRYEMSADAEL